VVKLGDKFGYPGVVTAVYSELPFIKPVSHKQYSLTVYYLHNSVAPSRADNSQVAYLGYLHKTASLGFNMRKSKTRHTFRGLGSTLI
jgi:hypothetical protein